MVTSTDIRPKDIFHVFHHIHSISNIKSQKNALFYKVLYKKKDGFDGFDGLP